jgi:hypothetical protein
VCQLSEGGRLDFRRVVRPLPTGRVKVVTEVRLEGKLVGRISQVRGGWQYRPIGSKMGGKSAVGAEAGEVFPTVDECKRSLPAE